MIVFRLKKIFFYKENYFNMAENQLEHNFELFQVKKKI